jgi:hypothetical protein
MSITSLEPNPLIAGDRLTKRSVAGLTLRHCDCDRRGRHSLAQRTRFTGRIATAPIRAQPPATAYSRP